MYIPPAFAMDDRDALVAAIRAARLSHFITFTAKGLMASALPLLLDPAEGANGTLYGHLARANPQWREPPRAEAMALFMGPDAYVSPAFYATKRETGKVVPTWNYVSVEAFGVPEFFDDPARLLDVVTRLTNRHEGERAEAWKVSDAPADFIASQLRGIVGIRLPITRLAGKRKMSQNRSAADRAGVVAGLAESPREADRVVAGLIPAG
jgi:transcriptional regulator